MPRRPKVFASAIGRINEEMGGRAEYLITDIDKLTVIGEREFCDYISYSFRHNFKMTEVDDDDNLWYRTLTLRRGADEYYIAWHEDNGTVLYSQRQDTQSLREFERMINTVLTDLNRTFGYI